MVKLSEIYQAGDTSNLDIEQLYLILLDIYEELAIAINKKPDINETPSDGDITDTILSNGTININTSTFKVEMLVDHTTVSTVTWSQLSP